MLKTTDKSAQLRAGDLSSPRIHLWPHFLTLTFPVTWEIVLIGGLLALALVTRLWALGARVMSHDESLHVYYAWRLASGQGFSHSPMMHGPFLFEATALINLFFGASDFSSRLAPAILGIFIVVAVPQLLKPWLGRGGALVTSTLLLISPYVLYYSRYIRHDIQVIAWTLLLIVAILGYLHQRRERDLTLLTVALALMFATMEMTFIYLAIFATFLALRMVTGHGLRWGAIRQTAEFDVLVLLATLGGFFSAPIALLILNPLWTSLTNTPFVDWALLGSQDLEWAAGPAGLRLWGLLAVFILGSTVVGLWWGGKRWLKLAGLFGATTVLLFTTFLTNPAGLGTGLIGSLGYWLAQQEVARGGQPWYYYLLVFPLYEYLALLGGIFAAVFYLMYRNSLSLTSRIFVSFTLWWAGLLFVVLSLAGEKMPWHSTHLAVPFILLSGWWIGRLVEGDELMSRNSKGWLWNGGRGIVFGGLALLALLTLRTSFAVNYLNYNYTTEFIGYAHGAPGVKWALADIEAIANHTGQGRDLKIAYDDEVSWPMVWYLRDFPNQAYFGAEPTRQALDAPVVLAGAQNWPKVEPLLGNRYHRFEVIWRWWPLEDYKGLTWTRLRSALTNPAMRTALWDIVWRRDYRRYAGLTGQALNPPVDWPLASRMRIYVRQDIASQMLSLSLGPTHLADNPPQVDAYAGLQRQLEPQQIVTGGNLTEPRGAAVGVDGSVYVADTGNSRIVRFNNKGEVLASWGGRSPAGREPPASGSFVEPWGVAVDPQGNVYVADTWNHRVQKFDPEGRFLLAWGGPGQLEDSPDRMWGPRGLAVTPEGWVYVADTGNKRVVVFDSNGRFLFSFGTEGEGRLDEPVGIAMDSSGQVYVADTWNQRVAVFSAGGEFQHNWPVQGWNGFSLDNKPYLGIDAAGRVYVTDPEGYRVIVFSSTGEPLAVFGQFGPEKNAFGLPAGLAVRPDNRIWVVDAGNNRLAVYEFDVKGSRE